MKKIVLYFNGSSLNHGCQAISRSVKEILKNNTCVLYSFNEQEDIAFEIDKILELKNLDIVHSHKLSKKQKIYRKIKNIFPVVSILKNLYTKYRRQKHVFNEQETYNQFKKLFNDNNEIFLSVGGDNYCYGVFDDLVFINKQLNKQNKKTVLFGCSIEPEDIEQDKTLREDLNRYSLITARESLTYNALLENGINKNTHLFPDPAFILDVQETKLPKNFLESNTVGINLSPLVLEKGTRVVYKNFIELILYILKNTNMNICLIPHVLWENDNDLETLTKLYNYFKNTNRLSILDDGLICCNLKYIISKCRFMIASRTHASIAAYSTQVPTLVIGYSVKAKGIAKDIFGDYKDYVLSVQNLQKVTEVTDAFKKLMQNEDNIRQHYKNFMPNYIEKTWLVSKEIEKILYNTNND